MSSIWLLARYRVDMVLIIGSREPAAAIPAPRRLVDFEVDGEVVRIIRAKGRRKDGRGARLIAHLRGRGDVARSTDAIMALTRDH